VKRPELLVPAGNLEKARVALAYGADAIYLGGQQFGLRARAGNFTLDEIEVIVEEAHQRGVKVYVTVNIFARNRHLPALPVYIKELAALEVDGLIVADPAVFSLVKRHSPLPVHISTQANVTNWEAVLFWEKLGASRVNLARELTLDEIAAIRQRVSLELEGFVHGAMCLAYSGRCLLSAQMIGRSANLGDCAQSCRWSYALMEAKRPGEYYPVDQEPGASYVMNSRDLCMIEHIPDLLQAGMDSLKIEGRMKSVHYVATVTKTYREALDAYLANPDDYRTNPAWILELDKVSHRPYNTGFYFDSQGPGQAVKSRQSIRSADFLGVVEGIHQNGALVGVRNHIRSGEELEILAPTGPPWSQQILLYSLEGDPLLAAHANDKVVVPLDKVEPYSILRRLRVEAGKR
jgi:putative protease